MLVETLILNEGQVEDLLAANPQLQPAVDAGIKKPEQLKWLLRMEKFEPIADIAGLIPTFEKNKQRLVIKDLNLYKHPNDLRAALEAAGESKGQQRRQLKESESDIVYDDEQWLVVMPHTRESSIQWGKGTTWCTAATQSANLFYNYVGRKNKDIILFYILKKGADSTVDPNAKLSVGFIGGTPTLDGKKGGVSVNASNDGLTEASLKAILGSEFNLIMSAMESHSSKLKGQHPTKVAMQKIAASKDSSLLDKYTMGMDEEQRSDFIDVLFQYELSPEILTLLARDKDKNVRFQAVSNSNTTPELLTLLASDKDEVIRRAVARNPNTLPEVLTLLARDEDAGVREAVARNPNTLPEVLTLLARDEDAGVKGAVARKPNAPPEILASLAKDKDKYTRAYVAGNLNTPPELLTLLARDVDKNVRFQAVSNPNTTPELLTLLARDRNAGVRASVAQAFNAPPEALASLARDKDKVVRANAAGNPETPLSPELLTLLARDEYARVRSYAAGNPNAPLEILASLARDVDKVVRVNVARNPNAPLEILASLARDVDKVVRVNVARNPTYQKYLESQAQLTERWLRLAGLLN